MSRVDDGEGEDCYAAAEEQGAEVVHFDAQCLSLGDVIGDVDVRGDGGDECKNSTDPEEPTPEGILASNTSKEDTGTAVALVQGLE